MALDPMTSASLHVPVGELALPATSAGASGRPTSLLDLMEQVYIPAVSIRGTRPREVVERAAFINDYLSTLGPTPSIRSSPPPLPSSWNARASANGAQGTVPGEAVR
jgi:hypothetical protein